MCGGGGACVGMVGVLHSSTWVWVCVGVKKWVGSRHVVAVFDVLGVGQKLVGRPGEFLDSYVPWSGQHEFPRTRSEMQCTRKKCFLPLRRKRLCCFVGFLHFHMLCVFPTYLVHRFYTND